MDPATSALLVGSAAAFLSACVIFYVSIMDEALHNYNLSVLFEMIPEGDETRQTRFENLTRRDDEFIQACNIARIVGFVVHLTGWILVVAPNLEFFTTTHLAVAGLLTICALVVCVVFLPPLLIRGRDETAILVLLPTFAWFAALFRPLTIFSTAARRMGARIEGVHEDESAEDAVREELADSLEEAEREGLLDEDEREMIDRIVVLGQMPAHKAMIPRTDMVCADLSGGVEGALETAVRSGHSRVPVYEGDRDHIIGIFYTRDLVPTWGMPPDQRSPDLRKLVRPAHYWPETKPLDDLLREMREDRLKIAILLDEHGGTAGLITLEDILEEIVGDIRDEFDEGEVVRTHRPILPFVRGQAEADGDVDLDEVNRVLEVQLPESPEYNSVGGLILHRLGRMAVEGDEVEEGGVQLVVLKADDRRIQRVAIRRTGAESESGFHPSPSARL